jgi:hypothetical protein
VLDDLSEAVYHAIVRLLAGALACLELDSRLDHIERVPVLSASAHASRDPMAPYMIRIYAQPALALERWRGGRAHSLQTHRPRRLRRLATGRCASKPLPRALTGGELVDERERLRFGRHVDCDQDGEEEWEGESGEV